MDPIQEAIEDVEPREDGASFSYREAAKKFGVNRTTLSRRHQGLQRPRDEEQRERQLLNPQQEQKLLICIHKDALGEAYHRHERRYRISQVR